eukprot:2974105-Pleurochrysis_carterae.AAC.1
MRSEAGRRQALCVTAFRRNLGGSRPVLDARISRRSRTRLARISGRSRAGLAQISRTSRPRSTAKPE